MNKKLGIVTSVFAIALSLSACAGQRDYQRVEEPVNNKAYESTLELTDAKTIDSTTELDGKKFVVKAIGPVTEKVDGLPKVDDGERRIGITYDNQISPASSASASVDGMPQELLGVKSGEGTIVVVVPEDATNAYALLSFGTKGSISIDLLDGEATAKPPVSVTEIPAGKLAPDTNPQLGEHVMVEDDPNADLGEAPEGTQGTNPKSVVPDTSTNGE